MNGYELTRRWYNHKFENPDKVRHIHSDFYFYLVDQWNRLGQKSKMGLPTDVTMEALGIGSYNTYKKALADLVDFGFLKIVTNSINQHTSKVVALSFIDEPTDKALDKATAKASDKPTDTIIEQLTIEQLNNTIPFSEFWESYGKKVGDKTKCESKWEKLDSGTREKIIKTLPSFIKKSTLKGKEYQPYPLTYFNQKRWNDEYQEETEVKNTSGLLKPMTDEQYNDFYNQTQPVLL